MGVREKVSIALVVIVLTQIACRHCMPRTPTKASLKRYLNDLKPVKNNPVPTPYPPSKVNKKLKQTFGKTAQNGRTSQNPLPKKSLHKTFNFPENEYPLDNFPRDTFRMGMNFNENNHVNTLQKARDLQSSAINNLKKERKIKRKLLSNKQANNEYGQFTTRSASNPNLIRLLESETFPEVQYPLNTMETWGTNYRNYLPLTLEKPFDGIGRNTFSSNPLKQDIKQPFTRLTKAKASKFLQSYDKLKEEHRRTSTENCKRSNAGPKGLNFTKTATCEKVSDDFITAGLLLNVPSNSTEVSKTLELTAKTFPSAENTCSLTEHPYDPMPLPYKVIEDNNENVCPAIDMKNYTKEFENVDGGVLAQTLRLIEELLLNDDTNTSVKPSNVSKEIEKNENTAECADASAPASNLSKEIDKTENTAKYTDAPATSRNFSEEIEKTENTAEYTDALAPSINFIKEIENSENTAEDINTSAPSSNFSKEIEKNENTAECADASAPASNLSKEIDKTENTAKYTDAPATSRNFSEEIEKTENTAEYTDALAPSINFIKEIENSENTAENINTSAPSSNFSKEIEKNENTAECADASAPASNLSKEIDKTENTAKYTDAPATSRNFSEEIEKTENTAEYTDALAPSINFIKEIENSENTAENINTSAPSSNFSKEIEKNENTAECADASAPASNLSKEIDKTENTAKETDTPASSSNFSKEIEKTENTAECTDASVPSSNLSKEIKNTENTAEYTDAPGSSSNSSREIESNENTAEYSDVPSNEDLLTTSMDSAEATSDSSAEEISQISVDIPADIIPCDQPLFPKKTISDNTTTVAGPLNVRMSLPVTEPTTCAAPTNASNSDPSETNTLSKVNTVAGHTSIIIIPINNDVFGKPQSHIFETTPDTPIIVYLPSTQSSGMPSQILSQIVSSSLENPVPNNQLYNALSNMAPVQNDSPSSTALVNELLNGISDSGSSLPMHETLPNNSMCNNNENSPSSIRVKPTSDILIHKSSTDDAIFDTESCDEMLSQQAIDTDNLDVNPKTLPETPNFEHPIFDFADNDITSLSHGPYNNVINNELPIIAREIDSDLPISNTSYKDSSIPTNNIKSKNLHETNSTDTVLDDSFFEILNDVPIVALDQDISFETPDSLEILEDTPPSKSLPKAPTDKSVSTSPISKEINEGPLQIDEIPTKPIETPKPKLTLTTEAPLPFSKTLSDPELPIIMDTTVPLTIVADTTIDTPQPVENTPIPSPILNNTTESTDMSLKSEIYKIRQILDKMLFSGIHIDSQAPQMDTALSSVSETDSLPLPEKDSLAPIQMLTDYNQPSPMDATLTSISDAKSSSLTEEQSESQFQTSPSSQRLPIETRVTSVPRTDSLPMHEKQSISPIETPTVSQVSEMDVTLSPIQTPKVNQPSRMDAAFSPIQAPTAYQPPAMDATLSPIQTSPASLPSRMDATWSPIPTPTAYQPPEMDAAFSPIQTPTAYQPPAMDATLSPIQTSPASLPSRMDATWSPIQRPTAYQPPEMDAAFSPIQTPTAYQPPAMDATSSPIQTSPASLPSRMDATCSPIQTPTAYQPPEMDAAFSPIQTPTAYQPPAMDVKFSPIQPFTDSQPSLIDAALPPIQTPAANHSSQMYATFSTVQTPTFSQPSQMNVTLSPIQTPNDRQISQMDATLSPIQTLTVNQSSQIDTIVSPIQTPTDSQLSRMDTTFSPIQTSYDSQQSQIDATFSPIQTPTFSQPSQMDVTLPPIQTSSDNQISQMDATLSPIQTLTVNQPSQIDTIVSPIQTPTDSQLSRIDYATFSPIQTSYVSQPSQMDVTLPPIQTSSDNQISQMDATLSPIQTLTVNQPSQIDTIVSPIQTPTDSQLSRIDATFSPIQTSYVSQPSQMDATFSLIQTPTDSQLSRMDATLSSIHTLIDSLISRMDTIVSPIQTPMTVSQPSRMDTIVSPIRTPTVNQLSRVDTVVSPIQTPSDSSPLRDKTLSHILDTDSLPLPDNGSVLPIQTDSEPSQIDATLSLIETPTDRVDAKLSLVQFPIDTQILMEKTMTPTQTLSVSKPSQMDITVHPVSNTNSLSLLENQSLTHIQTPTDTQLPRIGAIFSPIQTPTHGPPPQFDTSLAPISDIDTLAMINNQLLLPTQTFADRVPVPVGDKTISHLPVTNILDSLHVQELRALSITTFENTSTATSLSPMDEKPLSKSLLKSSGSPHLFTEETVSPAPVFETAIVNKPYLIDNLVTPASEAVTTSRIKDTFDNGLPHAMEDLTLKMDLDFPIIYDVGSDDVQLSVDDLPIKGHQKSTDSPLSILDLPMDVDKPFNIILEVPVSDLLTPTEVLLLPVKDVVEVGTLGISSDNYTSFQSDSMDEVHQNFPLSKDSSYKLSVLPLDESFSSIHQTVPHLSHFDGLYKKPFVMDDSPLPVIDKTPEIPTTDTKVSTLVDNSLLSMEDNASLDNLVHDIPNTMSLNDDKTLPLPDNTPTDVSLSINKTPYASNLPVTKALLENVLSDINKGVLTSQVVKALPPPPSQVVKMVYNAEQKSPLPETKEVPLPPVEKVIPNAEHADNLINNFLVPKITDDTADIDFSTELPLPDDKMNKDKPDESFDSVEDRIKNETHSSDNPTNDKPLSEDNISSLIDISRNKAQSSSKLSKTKALLENVLLDINTKGFSLPVSKVHPASLSSVLDKTIDYTDSLDSDITVDSLSIPVAEIIPSTAHSDHQINNSLPYPEQSQDTLSLEEDRMLLETPSLDFPKMTKPKDHLEEPDFKGDLTSLRAENLPLPSSSSIDQQLFTNNKNKQPSSLKLPITKAILENVLSEVNTKGFSIPVSKPLLVTSSSALSMTPDYIDSPISVTTADTPQPTETADDSLPVPFNEISPNTSVSDHKTDNSLSYSEQSVKPLSLEEDKISSEIPSVDISTGITSPLVKAEPDSNNDLTSLIADHPYPKTPSNTNNTPYTSKLPITKALLENVLSDINTKGLSLPVSKAVPAASRSQLDKTRYYMEIPLSVSNEDSPLSDVVKENNPVSKTYEQVFQLPTDKVALDHPILDLDELPIDKMFNDESDDMTEELQDSYETLNIDQPTEDANDFANDEMFNDYLTKEIEDPYDTLSAEELAYNTDDFWTDKMLNDDKTEEVENSDETPSLGNLASQMNKQDSLTDDISGDFPVKQSRNLLSSRLPITKALLEKVLTDISDGAIASKDFLNRHNH